MATPPFNLDTSDPTDTSLGNAFPANERAFRDQVNSYLNTEHDINTGYHEFQKLTTTQKAALTSPPAGMLVYDTTLAQLQINTGTSSAPVWTGIARSSAWFWKTSAPALTAYTCAVADTGTLFQSGSSTSGLVVTLPSTTGLPTGWFVGFMQTGALRITAAVNGGAGEKIQGAGNISVTSLQAFNSNFELFILSFDGTNWDVIGASPNSWPSGPAHPQINRAYFASTAGVSGTWTIPTNVTQARVLLSGGGGGGGGGYAGGVGTGGSGGGGGGFGEILLTGLTPGDTIAYTAGGQGAAGPSGSNGTAGGDSSISSGTMVITTVTCHGGNPGVAGVASGSVLGGLGGTTVNTAIGSQGAFGGNSDITIRGLGGAPGALGGGGGEGAPPSGGAGSIGANGVVVFEWVA